MQEFREYPPDSETVTPYDRQCFKLYIMLLEADAFGAVWDEAYEPVFCALTTRKVDDGTWISTVALKQKNIAELHLVSAKLASWQRLFDRNVTQRCVRFVL